MVTMVLSRVAPRLLQAASSATSRAFPSSFIVSRSLATVGDKLPAGIELHKGFPPDKIDIYDFSKDKKMILLGLPGAFTPTWSTKQIPHYKEHQDALRKLGIDTVVIYAVNDAAVMQAWAKDQRLGLSILQLMGDPAGDLTRALDMELTHPGPQGKGLFGRCKRHALYVDHGVIKAVRVSEAENDPAGDADPSKTLADAMMKVIQEVDSK